jgi:sulfate adenylyltransferase subunit 2
LHLAKKAFAPGPIPFPLLHVDTGFKFPEMYEFRDRRVRELGVDLVVYRNEAAISEGTNPGALGTKKCCSLLKTQALLDALKAGGYDAAIGGARRDEEKSRSKERIFSFRDSHGQWDPKNQRPEFWNIYNANVGPGESIRVFPLSNWTEIDIWCYIHEEKVPVVPLYFAKERPEFMPGLSRFRSLGCMPCTGAVRSSAKTVAEIINEVLEVKVSERATRAIDFDQEGSMELKKREGYF